MSDLDAMPPPPPRNSHEKLLELYEQGFAMIRDEVMRDLSMLERMALQPLLVTAEIKLRKLLASVEPAQLDDALLHVSSRLLELRSDDADGATDAPRVSVPVGELALLRRKDEWCREQHHTEPEQP